MQLGGRFQLPAVLRSIEHWAIHPFIVPAANAEADCVQYLVHDSTDVRAQIGAPHIETHSLIATTDVEPYASGTDGISISDDTTNRHSVTEVIVRHQGNSVRGLRTCTYLPQRLFVRFPKHRYVSIDQLHFHSSFFSGAPRRART